VVLSSLFAQSPNKRISSEQDRSLVPSSQPTTMISAGLYHINSVDCLLIKEVGGMKEEIRREGKNYLWYWLQILSLLMANF